MPPSDDDVPKHPDDWIAIADRELKNLKGSYEADQTNDAKIDHAVRAVEAALKAITWKHEKWTKWPPKSQKATHYLYKHNLDALLDRCGLRNRLQLSPDHRASWQVLINTATKQYRYSPNLPSDVETHAVAKSVRHPDTGIVPWLKRHYRTIP